MIFRHLVNYDPETMKTFFSDAHTRLEGNTQALAEEFGIARGTLTKLMDLLGIEYRTMNVRHISRQEIITMVTKHRGKTNPAAKEMKIGQQRLVKLMTEYDLHGILPPGRHPYWDDLS